MIVLLIGGPAAGLFENLPDKDSFRVATVKMLMEGKAAFYVLGEKHFDPKLRFTLAAATFTNVRDSAQSLVDLVIDSDFGHQFDAAEVDTDERKE